MNSKILATFFAALVAVFSLLAPVPESNSIEAARLNNIGVAYMNQQLFEKGLKQFQLAAQADPKFPIARLNEGVAYLNLQKVDQAKTDLEDAIKQDPKNPNAWYSLGLLAKNTGDAQASIEAFKHVTEIDPDDADTWYFLGTAYVQAKQFPQAIDAFQKALKINPIHASAEFGLSRAYQQSGDTDHAREHLKKFQYITQNKIGSPMSLAYGEQGKYSRAVESPQAALKPPAQIKVQFVDATKESGIITRAGANPSDILTSMGPGACFLDYDGDGKPDVFVPSNGPQGGFGLFHNLGAGKFEDVTKKLGLDPSMHGNGCAAGDYDNDGFTDLAVTLDHQLVLLHNEKGANFKDVSSAAGLKSENFNLGVTFIDYDHDGDIDLYVTRFAGGPALQSGKGLEVASMPVYVGNLMFRNNGDSTFTDVTESTGLAGERASIAAVGTDFNNDRAVDLVRTGTSPSPVFLANPREGKFIPDEKFRTTVESFSLGAAILDFDHDGWMDFAFSHPGPPAAHSLAQQ